MNIQDYLDGIIKSNRRQRISESDQLTIGEIISKVKAISDKEGELHVQYDFADLYPTDIDSWRGSYDELALNHSSGGDKLTGSEFVRMLGLCIGKTFTGYKGGEYVMSEDTPVWVANYGDVGSTAVVDVVETHYSILLITGYRPY